MQNEIKNPIPFNPHVALTGGQAQEALQVLRDIFYAYERGDDEPAIGDLVHMKYIQLQRSFSR